MNRRSLALAVLLVLAGAGIAHGQAGSLDSSFGADGRTVTSVPPTNNNRLFDMALAPDGTIVAVGDGDAEEPGGWSTGFAVARLSGDGQLIASTGFHLVPGYWISSQDVATSVAVQADGRIVIAGNTCPVNECAHQDVGLVRLLPSLAPDPTFGDWAWQSGISITRVPHLRDGAAGVSALAIQPDGRIVVAGTFGLLCYKPEGTLDTAFGNLGRVPSVFPPLEIVTGLALKADGRIVVIGVSDDLGPSVVTVAQYLPDGTPDPTFGTSGKAFATGQSGFASSVVVQPDARIVVAGSLVSGGTEAIAVWRFNANGTLDSTFGEGGYTTAMIGALAGANAVAVQNDGRIVVAGFVTLVLDDSGATADLVVARFLADGAPDTAFGYGGAANTDFLGSQDIGEAVVLQSDGGIVVGGWSLDVDYEGHFAFAKYYDSPPNQPPVISSALATPDALWPRNHKMIDVTIRYDVIDDFDAAAACQLTVKRDETTPAATTAATDWEIIDAHHVRLRAGRPGPPRAVTYTIGIACTDTGGLEAQQEVFVYVPLRP